MAAVLKVVEPRHLFTVTCMEQMYVARCMAMAAMPFVDKTTGAVEHGVFCNGCRSDLEPAGERQRHRVRGAAAKIYSREGFLTHFKECKYA
jgi:hypothetical protein